MLTIEFCHYFRGTNDGLGSFDMKLKLVFQFLGRLLHALGEVYVFLTVPLDYTIYDYR